MVSRVPTKVEAPYGRKAAPYFMLCLALNSLTISAETSLMSQRPAIISFVSCFKLQPLRVEDLERGQLPAPRFGRDL